MNKHIYAIYIPSVWYGVGREIYTGVSFYGVYQHFIWGMSEEHGRERKVS